MYLPEVNILYIINPNQTMWILNMYLYVFLYLIHKNINTPTISIATNKLKNIVKVITF
jgi:hypothetical protein